MVKIICVLLLSSLLSAQELKIIEVLDANLFRIKDSTLIALVNLDVPSINDSDSIRAELAQTIIKYAKIQFMGYSIRFEKSTIKCSSNDNISFGHVFKIYPLSEKNISASYLENGYAVYLPCDSFYMELYTNSAKKGMFNKKGIWKTQNVQRPVNYFNRMRVSLILFEKLIENDFIPIFGFNYRWSDIYPFIKDVDYRLSLSGEVGTFIYFYLPYANIGSEFRIKNFYARVNYNIILPIFAKSKALTFIGYDFGFYVPFGKRSGLEFELNIKEITKDPLLFYTITFPIY